MDRFALSISARRRWVERALIAYSVVASSLGAAFFARRYPDMGDVSFARLVLWQMPPYLAWAVLLPIIARAGRSKRTLVAIAGYCAAGVVLIPLHALFTTLWLAWAYPTASLPTNATALVDGAFQRIPIDLLMYCALVGTLYARDYAILLGEERSRAERLERELLAARLDALQAQLRPHFLFNTLQSITVLIRRDADGAVRMTKDLAALLRHSLATAPHPLVTLDSEIELLERYVAIEEVRFSDRLRVSFDVDPATRNCLVPDLLLQPLVENAILHGVAPRAEGGSIAVRGWFDGPWLCLEVRDDGVGIPEGPAPARVGLGVTRSRLEGLYGSEYRLELSRGPEGGTVVRIDLPTQRAASKEAM
jgi:signal transduction histidine kinase